MLLQGDELRNWFEERLESNKVYQKVGLYLYRFAEPGETILTMVAGQLETIKTVPFESDFGSEVILRNILIGSAAETYIVSRDKFASRYDTETESVYMDGRMWKKAMAKGKCQGFYYYGPNFKLIAPWGEEMLVQDGDFVARPVPGNENDIYRIEKDAFAQTYHLET